MMGFLWPDAKQKTTNPNNKSSKKSVHTRNPSNTTYSPSKLVEEEPQYIEQLAINIILVGNGLPKETFHSTHAKYNSLQQIVKQNLILGNCSKKVKLGDTKIRFKLLEIVPIEEIIYNKYKQATKQWQSVRQPKMFIFMYHHSNFDDLSQIYKFCKDVEHLYSRKTLNSDEMKRINGLRLEHKKNFGLDHQKNNKINPEELGNWVTGLMVCDNFVVDASPAYRQEVSKCKEQSLQICGKYHLLYLQTTPSELKSTCNSIYFWATLLKLSEIGQYHQSYVHLSKITTFLNSNNSYRSMPEAQKRQLKTLLQGAIDYIENIDSMILRIYTQIDELLDYILAIQQGIYEYAQQYYEIFATKTTQKQSQLGSKIDGLLDKKKQILIDLHMLNLIRLKNQSKKLTTSNADMIGNYKNQPPSKATQIEMIYEMYTSMATKQLEIIYQRHNDLLKSCRSFIKSKLKQSLSYDMFKKVWEDSDISEGTLQDDNDDKQRISKKCKVNMKDCHRINQQLLGTKNLFWQIFSRKLDSIKSKIKDQISVVRLQLDQKNQLVAIRNQRSTQLQKYIDVMKGLSKEVECAQTLYAEIIEEIESQLLRKLTVDLLLFDQIVRINQANQCALQSILNPQKGELLISQPKKSSHPLQYSQEINHQQIINDYLTNFYLEKMRADLTNEKKQRELIINANNIEKKRRKSKIQQEGSFELRNELLQKLKKCTLKKKQYVQKLNKILQSYEKVEMTDNILKILRESKDSRLFQLKYVKFASKRTKKPNQILLSQAEMLTQPECSI